jgi:hypothetical protein
MSDANILTIGALPFQALAEQNERLIGLSRELRARPEAGRVITGIDCRTPSQEFLYTGGSHRWPMIPVDSTTLAR